MWRRACGLAPGEKGTIAGSPIQKDGVIHVL
jgi:hypothetical protein